MEKGCDFVLNDCVVNGGEIPDYSRGYFCNNSLEQNYNGQLYGDLTCDPSHTHKAFCDLSDQGPPVPEEYQYFNNKVCKLKLLRMFHVQCILQMISKMLLLIFFAEFATGLDTDRLLSNCQCWSC